MKIKLSNYRDLGKCAFATLLEEYDTEKDHIYVYNGGNVIDSASYDEVTINNVRDLFPYLWTIPGIRTNDGYFITTVKPWWEELKSRDIELFSQRMKREMELLEDIKIRLDKAKKKGRGKLLERQYDDVKCNIDFYNDAISHAKNLISVLNEEMKKQQELLIAENE